MRALLANNKYKQFTVLQLVQCHMRELSKCVKQITSHKCQVRHIFINIYRMSCDISQRKCSENHCLACTICTKF